MPERTPLKGRGVHSAYVYVGAGLFVASVLVVGTMPALLVEGGGTGGGGDVWSSTTWTLPVPDPTYEVQEPNALHELLRGVDIGSVSAIDVDRTPPGAGESWDVAVQEYRNGKDVARLVGRTLVKAPDGTVVSSPDMCAKLLGDIDSRAKLVPVSPDDTVCLRTDEGRVASVVVTAVGSGGGVEAEVTVWKWLGSQ
ncbi:hypothetical protein [Streptomyces sp. NPDC047042]|uniref:hypothetical protein n=1 Tax=Streptomyces sp. NPDC047042 TaxID=3154807 RepID=UPI0033EC3683